jgi:uncharacterized protein (DUF2147 family)
MPAVTATLAPVPLMALLTVTAAAPAPVTGRWVTVDGKAVVAITQCGKTICGRIVEVLNPAPGQATTDVHNPDPAKRNRPIKGLTILTGFTPAETWWTGEIYDPKSGKTYTSYLAIEGARLKVQGCIGPLCQTQYWTKAR